MNNTLKTLLKAALAASALLAAAAVPASAQSWGFSFGTGNGYYSDYGRGYGYPNRYGYYNRPYYGYGYPYRYGYYNRPYYGYGYGGYRRHRDWHDYGWRGRWYDYDDDD